MITNLLGQAYRWITSFTRGREADHAYSLEDSLRLLNLFKEEKIDEFFAVNRDFPFIHVCGIPSCLSIGHQTQDGVTFVLDGKPTTSDVESLLKLLYSDPERVLKYSNWTQT